jgi:hypothetical protein
MIGDAVISRRDRGSVNRGRFLGLFATFWLDRSGPFRSVK